MRIRQTINSAPYFLFPLFIKLTRVAISAMTTNAKTAIIIIPLLQSTKGINSDFILTDFKVCQRKYVSIDLENMTYIRPEVPDPFLRHYSFFDFPELRPKRPYSGQNPVRLVRRNIAATVIKI